MTQIHHGCPGGPHAAETCDHCDTCRKAGNYGLCFSGKHVWLDEESAAKCCNGWRSELVVVEQRSDLEGIRTGSLQYIPECEAHVARRWVKIEDDEAARRRREEEAREIMREVYAGARAAIREAAARTTEQALDTVNKLIEHVKREGE